MSKPLIILIAVIAIALGGALLLSRHSSKNSADSSISGTFNINGNIPAGSTITTKGKEYGSDQEWQTLNTGVAAVDGSSWKAEGLKQGATYEGYAELVSGGKVIAKSDTITVTAPASQVPVVINIESANGEANAEISGNVIVRGFIPEGSTITLEGRVAGTPEFTEVNSGIPAKQSTSLSYDTAISGESYEIKGLMYDGGGNEIGSSSLLVITAPAKNEVLTINSSAQAPTPAPGEPSPTQAPSNSVISGSINFNGVAPQNSRIVILQRVYGSTDYQVAVDNVSPQEGASWSWNKAKASTWYDIEAVLKQKQENGTDKDIAISQTSSVAAPATGVRLTINSGVAIPAPNGQVSMLCGSMSGSQWNSTLTLPFVSGAKSYWYQVGTSQGGNNIANTTTSANGNNDVQVNVGLPNNQTVYFRYAYANVSGVGVGNPQFSPFSASSQGTCGN